MEFQSQTVPARQPSNLEPADAELPTWTRSASLPATRARRWLILRLCGGFLLAACFFMPIARGCNEDIIPADEVRSQLAGSRLDDGLLLLDMFGAAYLLGAVLAFHAAVQLTGWRRFEGLGRGAINLALALICFSLLAVGVLLTLSASPGFWSALLVIPAGICVYLWMARRTGDRAHLCSGLVGSALLVVWFSYWCTVLGWGGHTRYGLWLSWLAGIMLMAAVLGEGRLITSQGIFATAWAILRCRIPRQPPGCCRSCGYLLQHLTEMRCPECGRAFTFAELGVTAEELHFGQSVKETASDGV